MSLNLPKIVQDNARSWTQALQQCDFRFDLFVSFNFILVFIITSF